MRPFEKISVFILAMLIIYTDFFQVSVREISGVLAAIGSLFVLFTLLDLYQTKTPLYILFPREIIFLLIFLFWTFITGIIIAPNKSEFLSQEVLIVEFTIICICILNLIIKSEKNESFLIKVILFSAIADAINLLINGQTMSAAYDRVTIGDVNTNAVATIFCVSMIGVLYFWIKSNKKKLIKICLIAISILLLYAIILTETRQAFFAYVLMLALYYIFIGIYNRKNNYIEIIKKMGGFALLIVIALLGFNYILNSTGLGARIMLVSDSLRKEYYQLALDLFIQHPITGVGINGFKYYNFNHVYSHSTYAELISCTGIVGTILYISILIVLTKKCIKIAKKSVDIAVKQKAKIYIVLLLTFAFLGTTNILFYNMFSYIWIALISGFVARENRKIYFAKIKKSTIQ